MMKMRWFENAAEQGSWQVPVIYHNEQKDQIALLDWGCLEFAVAVQNDTSLNHEEIEIYHENMKSLKLQLGSQAFRKRK